MTPMIAPEKEQDAYMDITRREETDMTVTIHEGNDKAHVVLGSKDNRFAQVWGDVYKCPVSNIYRDLSQITYWCNNELKEECLFEVE